MFNTSVKIVNETMWQFLFFFSFQFSYGLQCQTIKSPSTNQKFEFIFLGWGTFFFIHFHFLISTFVATRMGSTENPWLFSLIIVVVRCGYSTNYVPSVVRLRIYMHLVEFLISTSANVVAVWTVGAWWMVDSGVNVGIKAIIINVINAVCNTQHAHAYILIT